MPTNASLIVNVETQDTVLVYAYEGSLIHNKQMVKRQQLIRYSEGAQVVLQAGNEKTRVLFLTGTPIREPIAHYGTFVMNTEKEIQQAIDDYRNTRIII